MSHINVYLDASRVYEVTDLAKQSGKLRKATLPYGVHTTGKNWVGLEFYSPKAALKFRGIMRPRRKGLKIMKYFCEMDSCQPKRGGK